MDRENMLHNLKALLLLIPLGHDPITRITYENESFRITYRYEFFCN